MQNDTIARLSKPVPRYTSYPTAPHFSEAVTAETYAGWLGSLGEGQALSLYAHIPYCDRLCWFCACHTKQTLRYAPVERYLVGLRKEINLVGKRVDRGATVTALHLGGGSPTLLRPGDLRELKAAFESAFAFAADAEVSVEMDPNDLDAEKHDALAEIGLTRASLGIQDFDPAVQKAINRHQTFEQTRGVVEACRARGVRSVNCDVLYGLPHQSKASLRETLSAVLSMRPERIALFGYAHVPWMKKHQTMIDESVLPSAVERYRQMEAASAMLVAAGYVAIGIDHFALPGDTLALAASKGTLRRNFQGYTDDAADALLGFGASAIGQLSEGYVQNMPATGAYLQRVGEGELPVVRGYALKPDDACRAFVIERLMCDFALDLSEVGARFPAELPAIRADLLAFLAADRDGLAGFDGRRLLLTGEGRVFARVVAAAFDAHLASGAARHSVAV